MTVVVDGKVVINPVIRKNDSVFAIFRTIHLGFGIQTYEMGVVCSSIRDKVRISENFNTIDDSEVRRKILQGLSPALVFEDGSFELPAVNAYHLVDILKEYDKS